MAHSSAHALTWRRIHAGFIAGISVPMLATMAAGATITVPAGGNLQAALVAAQPGDVIALQAGATYVGNFTLPNKSGSSFITLQTGSLPVPVNGVRIGPADAPLLAKLRSPNTMPALSTAAAAHHWRIVRVEFQATAGGAGEIIALGTSSQTSLSQVPHDLVFDRVYVHGDPAAGQKRGIALNSAATTIARSYIADIKATGQDSQAIAGWNGPGPFTITNNYLEAAAENLMFGGGDPGVPNLVPSDITITDNHFTKRTAWRTEGWVVKNLLELKNARRVTIARNTFEYNWAGGQSGFAILFTVRNQDGGCPWCQVDHITFEQNIVRHIAAGISILGYDNNHPSRQTQAIVVRNNLFADIDRGTWGGNGYFLQISGGPQDITIDHNTIIQSNASGLVQVNGPAVPGFVFTNNVGRHSAYGIIGTDHGPGSDTIAAYFPAAQVFSNVIAGGNSQTYPAGNYFPTLAVFDAQFVSPATGDYTLVASSAWQRAGSDGADLGAPESVSHGTVMPENKMRQPGAGDFDGDGMADLALYRRSTGEWQVLKSTTAFLGALVIQWGTGTDIPVTGDYDGDGMDDLAVYRPPTGTWYILRSSTNYSTYVELRWGASTDTPVPGDYDGDGKTDLAVYRAATSTWYIELSSTDFTTYIVQQWGVNSDTLVPGDYDGDGKTDVGVYRAATGTWYVLRSSTNNTSFDATQWGLPTDRVVPGDYDGDGKGDLGVYRPSTGVWYILQSKTSYSTYLEQQWGSSTDVTVPGDYDGDGKTDPAVYRPSTGLWYALASRGGYTTFDTHAWGNSTDLPVQP